MKLEAFINNAIDCGAGDNETLGDGIAWAGSRGQFYSTVSPLQANDSDWYTAKISLVPKQTAMLLSDVASLSGLLAQLLITIQAFDRATDSVKDVSVEVQSAGGVSAIFEGVLGPEMKNPDRLHEIKGRVKTVTGTHEMSLDTFSKNFPVDLSLVISSLSRILFS